jgi:lipopolysaccharide transport system ATP-binding protein
MSSDATATTSGRPAVVADGLSKRYLLWDDPRDRLKQPIRSRLSRWFRVPDKQYFHEFWALKDISFELQAGETLGIIGRNGCGKSTLLQILADTLSPTTGSCRTEGRVSALLELGSGFNPEFTGRENVYMNAAILGLTKSEIDARYDDIVAFADIGEFIDQPVKMYSSGMYVRLAFAVAISVEPHVLVIDEALAVGDAFFVQKCMRFMRRFKEENTLVFVSHDVDAVMGLCDRAMLLEQGELKAAGTAKDVCELYRREYYATQQEVNGASGEMHLAMTAALPDLDVVDQRLKFINTTSLRNDIELFSFDAKADSFGSGCARIVDVRILDPDSKAPLSWMVGGERVALEVTVIANRDVIQAIIGFSVKNRLGQAVFGDNTFLTYRAKPVHVAAGTHFLARFAFRMPVLPAGDYVVAAAVADGTQSEHEQLHWVHDALAFHSHSSSASTGLVGVPMMSIVVELDDEATDGR